MTTEISVTVGCFYEGSPVPVRTIAEALSLSVNDLLKRVKAEEEAGTAKYRTVVRSIAPGTGRLLRGPSSIGFVPDWVES